MSRAGSIVTETKTTSSLASPRFAFAQAIFAEIARQISGQLVYTKATTTTFPSRSERVNSWPFWSSRVKSGASGGSRYSIPLNSISLSFCPKHPDSMIETRIIANIFRRIFIPRVDTVCLLEPFLHSNRCLPTKLFD